MNTPQLNLNIIEPSHCKSIGEIYFNGTHTLTLKQNAIARLQLVKDDEYLLFSKIGEDVYIARKTEGSNVFGWHTRNRNKNKPTYYITSKDLKIKLELTRHNYTLGASFEQQGFLWFKLLKI